MSDQTTNVRLKLTADTKEAQASMQAMAGIIGKLQKAEQEALKDMQALAKGADGLDAGGGGKAGDGEKLAKWGMIAVKIALVTKGVEGLTKGLEIFGKETLSLKDKI